MKAKMQENKTES